MTTNDLDISKMLTLSTAHIKPSTTRYIDEAIDCGSLAAYRKDGYGWNIHCIDLEGELPEDLPEDLKACIDLARRNGCDILCLDGDGDPTNLLSMYDWY